MEKQTKSSKKPLLRFLTFQNHPFSPTKTRLRCPLIPSEARLRPNKSLAQEPTSPKISCMGQIKLKKHVAKHDKVNKRTERVIKVAHVATEKPDERKSDGGVRPSLGQMRRFASGRDSIKSFDWTAQILPVDGEESIPFSCEPKKEINLWKRRTMAKPRPLSI